MTRNHRNRPEGNPSEGVGLPNTFITPARHRILSFALAICLLLAMVLYIPGPITAQAVEIENSPPVIDVYKTVIGFAGYKWVVIGYEGDGVYSNANDNQHATLLLEKDETVLSPIAFRKSDNNSYDTNESEYLNSTLHEEMEVIAGKIQADYPAEYGMINERSLTASDDANYPMWGNDVDDQKLWPLSLDEYLLVHNVTKSGNTSEILNFGSGSWWLRSPYDDNSVLIGSANGFFNPGYTTRVSVSASRGVRPAFQLNLSSVLFTSAAAGGASAKSGVGDGLVNATTVSGNAAIKLTVEDDGQELEGVVLESRNGTNELALSYTSATTGANQYISCILEDSGIKYYGKLEGTPNRNGGQITVPLNNVDDGIYTLKIFSEQDNGDYHTDFAGGFHEFKITVDNRKGTVKSSDATLQSIAGKTISDNGESGSKDNPKTATINLANGVEKIEKDDIIPTDSINATVNLYSDSGFTQDATEILLTAGTDTHLYIKVVAEDGITTLYYDITATIQPAGASTPPSVSTNNLTVTVGETADFTVNPGEGANAATSASISSSDTTIATATPTDLTLSLGQSGTVSVEGKSVGNATISIGYSGGSRNGGSDTVQVTVTDSTNHSGSGSTRSSGGSSSGGSTYTPLPKTTLPASAFSWDGRTLTINHDSITPLGLLSVRWDGATLTRGTDYEAYQGSVIVRFGEDFMAGQSPGDHTVRVEFLNHTVRVEFLNHTGETTVTVGAAGAIPDADDNDTYNPNTGGYPDGGMGTTDNPNTGDGRRIWLALLLGGLGAAALVLYPLQKQQTKMKEEGLK